VVDDPSSASAIWLVSLDLSFREALDFLEAAVRDCPDELWLRSMWPVPGPDAEAQRHSAPWGVAWHALQILDARLAQGGLVPWQASPALGVEPDFDITTLAAPWSQADLLGHLAYCRVRVADGLQQLTEERAAARLSSGHHRGKPYAWRLLQMLRHVTEHAAQIRQFITAAGDTEAT
jgi:hypothetical protein